MRRRLLPWLTAAVMIVIPAAAAAQVGQTAVLTGTVTDTSDAAIPGVTVTVTGPAIIGGSRSVVTGADGSYRFPALPPGLYTVTYELENFTTGKRENIRLLLGQTITVNHTLSVGGLQESVMVSAASPIVDMKSSSAQKNLPQEIMEFIPFTSRFGPGAMLLAPGVNPNNYSSYGSGQSSSNSYMIDGVDVSDPEGGTIWVFANHNWIQEVQVIGLGANAEFGGFTGVASNSLFRSGSNIFTGLFETLFENDALTGDNTTPALLEENPDLTAPTTDYITDTTLQIGGPIRKDKLWFFTSFQYYRPITAPAGYPPPVNPFYATGQWNSAGPDARIEHSPRFLFKPTFRIGQSDQLTGFFETDMYRVDGRGANSRTAPIATVHQDSPEVAWNVNYTKVLTSSSVFDVKYSGFWGYYYLSPYGGDDVMGWYDVDEDVFAVNSYYYYNADRTRNQANASITQFASGFAGEHSLKFGVEFERSHITSELGYPGGGYVLAYSGVPYYAYMWDGYLRDSINTRLAAYAQDSWQVNSRLTINPGIRVDHNRGFSVTADDTVFRTTSWGPRIGFAFDMFGTGRTVFKGHWGRYYDGAKSSYYDLLTPSNPFFLNYLDSNLNVVAGPYQVTAGGSVHTMDPDIKHPRLDQSILGVQHELFPNFAVGVTGIYRKNSNFIDDMLIGSPSGWSQDVRPDPGPDGVTGNGDDPGTNLTFFRQNTDPDDNRFLVTNPDGAYRKYRGVELTAEKRFANRWMMQASWVISKIEGNYNNTGNFGNSSEYDNPNLDARFQPFRDGRLTNDNTHIAKVLGMWRAPLGVVASTAFFYTSGQTFTRTVRQRIDRFREVFAEPRGSQRYDAQVRWDVKLEKQFSAGDRRRLGLTLEGFNLLNKGTITSRTTRSGSTYFTPRGLVQARRFRVGAVLRF
ncbi:MAG TPA: TonB-dependent receptor [Vicinamibacterales bacterium]|nr:TonB-dependent receptor [Vicinamibacterales bacterium]